MRRVWRFFNRASRDADLRDEIEAFVDELTARNVARGMTPAAARRAALIETGGVQQVREVTRDQWLGTGLETLGRDVRYGFRMIRRAPGFAAVVIATLGLVIGANATVFSVMHAVLWRPLPYPDVDRLVVIDSDFRGVRNAGISSLEGADLRAEAGLFEQLASIVAVEASVSVDGEMELVAAVSTTDDALPALGAQPMALGRPLQAARDIGSKSVASVVVSHDLWVRRLKSDPNVIGRHIEVNNLKVEVVGVLRPEFRVFLPANAGVAEVVDIWFPRDFESDRQSRGQITIAKLARGVSVAEAQTRLDAIAARFVGDFPRVYGGQGLRLSVRPLHDVLTGDVSRALWVLAGAVFFVLLIGCVNVANLMVARGRTRVPEIDVRRALGAGQLRLVRQLFTESVVLVALGALSGVVVAHAGVSLIDWLKPSHLPRQTTISLSPEAAIFIAAAATFVGIVFALMPAVRAARGEGESLRAGRVPVHRPGLRRLQRGMVVAEVALSIVPLITAGLMVRTFANLTAEPLGFKPDGIVTAKIAYSLREFDTNHKKWMLHRAALDRVRQVLGVEDVSAVARLPFDWPTTRTYAHPRDHNLLSRATMQSILPGYLRVTRTPLVAGREFSDDDITQERNVVIIDERIAAQLWPGRDAIGQLLPYQRGRDFVPLEVVGVTSAVRITAARDEASPHMFLPFHLWAATQALVIRTEQSPETLMPLVKQAVESLGTRRPVFEFRTLQSYADATVGDARFIMLVLVGFAATCVLLTAIGLYGTLAYLTSLRRQEFGIRMALGASAGHVLRHVAGEGLALATVGAALGFVGALMTSDAIAGLLYKVTPFDGLTLLVAAGAVALTALVASTHPAWRAARVDPTSALRAE